MLKANDPSNVIMFLVGVRVLGGLGVLPADAGLHVVGDDGAAGHEVEQQRHHQRRHQVRRHRRHPRLHTGARRQGQGSLDVAETGYMVSRASSEGSRIFTITEKAPTRVGSKTLC